MTRCAACPVEPGVDCLATLEPLHFGSFCALAASGSEIGRAHVAARARIGLAPPPAVPPVVLLPQFSEGDLLILACDYRDKSQACGCGELDYCAQARGSDPDDPHAVSYADCRRCASSSARAAPTGP
jgi:hypothetical protein